MGPHRKTLVAAMVLFSVVLETFEMCLGTELLGFRERSNKDLVIRIAGLVS